MDTDITLDLSHAVPYHLGAFPPQQLELATFFNEILAATDALSRYDQMLKTLHNSEILLAPLRSREAVISSRIEGTISTLDEILRYEAESTHMQTPREVRQDTVETLLYQRTLKAAQATLQDGRPTQRCYVAHHAPRLAQFRARCRKNAGAVQNRAKLHRQARLATNRFRAYCTRTPCGGIGCLIRLHQYE